MSVTTVALPYGRTRGIDSGCTYEYRKPRVSVRRAACACLFAAFSPVNTRKSTKAFRFTDEKSGARSEARIGIKDQT